jgi:hypothetical protein
MARRSRGQGSQGRTEGRVRGRVQERVRGRAKRGGGDSGRKRSTIDLGTIEGYANRLTQHSRGHSGSGIAGAASALAGGGFASRFMQSGTESSDEEFRNQVAEHFALMEERLQRIEEQVQGLLEQGATEEDLAQSDGESGSDNVQ